MDKKKLLDQLKKKMQDDTSLPLRQGATQLVFGDGNSDAEIVFIGEGPGYWEDLKGIPFVGNAGALLNQALRSIGIPRESVFITNVIHFRPPQNRDPLPAELKAFEPYLDKIIKIIDPKMIVTLGRYSMAKFIPNVTISTVHGRSKLVEWGGKLYTIVTMYHPAAALRGDTIKRMFLADFAKIPGYLEEAKKMDRNVETKQALIEKKNEQMSLV